MRYIPCMMKNLISVGDLKAGDLRGTLGEGILKMSNGSLVILKGIRHNIMYYLMGSSVTELANSEYLDGDSIKLWHRGLKQVGLILDQELKMH